MMILKIHKWGTVWWLQCSQTTSHRLESKIAEIYNATTEENVTWVNNVNLTLGFFFFLGQNMKTQFNLKTSTISVSVSVT